MSRPHAGVRIGPTFFLSWGLTVAGMGAMGQEAGGARSAADLTGAIPPAPAASLGTVLGKADVAVARHAIQGSLLKGNFAEAHMSRHLEAYLRGTGNWQPIRPRLGPQGLDGLMVRYDGRGNPAGLLVSESKFGASALKMTADGLQMGGRWTNARLGSLGRAYSELAEGVRSGKIAVEPVRVAATNQRLQFPLKDGKAAVFWRERPGQPWKFAGPSGRLAEAGTRSSQLGTFLRSASEGRIAYDRAIYRMELRGNALHVTIRDARGLDRLGAESRLPIRGRFEIPLGEGRVAGLVETAQREAAQVLKQTSPGMSNSQALRLAREAIRDERDLASVIGGEAPSPVRSVLISSAIAGATGAGIGLAIGVATDYWDNGHVEWGRQLERAGVNFAGIALGTATGQAVTIAFAKSPILQQFAAQTSRALGLGSAGLVSNTIGAGVGTGVAGVFIAYAGYFLGWYDLKSANRQVVAGTAGIAGGMVAGFGIMSFAMAFGTASTGAAISGLGGAAATSAAMAWLGGGALSAGGFGMAGGAVVMTGGIALAGAAIAGSVYWAYGYFDEKADLKRIGLTLDHLLAKESFAPPARGHFERVGIGPRPSQ